MFSYDWFQSISQQAIRFKCHQCEWNIKYIFGFK
uniref:Uncharacterized protein n=1 Tax=Anguilla anguilla TaxID=7936 RepID=A0A0E9RGR3_ANGAN